MPGYHTLVHHCTHGVGRVTAGDLPARAAHQASFLNRPKEPAGIKEHGPVGNSCLSVKTVIFSVKHSEVSS